MTDAVSAQRLQLSRQVAHWSTAAARLRELERFASAEAWAGLERYLGTRLRENLLGAVDRLHAPGAALQTAIAGARDDDDLADVRRQLVAFRNAYLRVETTLDFYGDAINTRTSPYLAACSAPATCSPHRSMSGCSTPAPYQRR